MKKVVYIRFIAGEYQIADVTYGLYNCIVSSGTFTGAVQYCEAYGYEWRKYNAPNVEQ